jgi:hypothetical protein
MLAARRARRSAIPIVRQFRRRPNLQIAILAWGSLVWDPKELALATEFRPNGPSLRLAFSRISRDGRLTLVIDEENGMPSGTFRAVSAFAHLDAAIENLRLREGMPGAQGIGFVDRLAGKRADVSVQLHPISLQAIETWVAASGYDAAIWTALAPNFRDKARRPYSVPAAMDYLASLDGPTRALALDYIRKSPRQIRSLLRAEVNARWRA